MVRCGPQADNQRMSLRAALAHPVRYGSLGAGMLPVLAFPAPDQEWFAWIALVPGLLLMQRAPRAREAVVRGWWFGAGFVLAAMYWLIPSIGPGLLLIAVLFGALQGAVGLAVWCLLRPPLTVRRSLAALLVVPSVWVVTEFARSWQALGGPWALLGATQWRRPTQLALASLGGIWLVSAAVVAVNTAVLIAVLADRTVLRACALAAGALLLAAGPVAFALNPAPVTARTATVVLVQPGQTPTAPSGWTPPARSPATWRTAPIWWSGASPASPATCPGTPSRWPSYGRCRPSPAATCWSTRTPGRRTATSPRTPC